MITNHPSVERWAPCIAASARGALLGTALLHQNSGVDRSITHHLDKTINKRFTVALGKMILPGTFCTSQLWSCSDCRILELS